MSFMPIGVCFFFLNIFLMWTIFKVFIEFVTILLLFYVFGFWPQGTWDLISLIRDRTPAPCIGRQSLNHWTTREVPTHRHVFKPLSCADLCLVLYELSDPHNVAGGACYSCPHFIS